MMWTSTSASGALQTVLRMQPVATLRGVSHVNATGVTLVNPLTHAFCLSDAQQTYAGPGMPLAALVLPLCEDGGSFCIQFQMPKSGACLEVAA